MGKQKNEIDELIRQALGEEEANYYEQLEEEQSLLEEGLGLFKGKRAWISVWISFVILAVFAGSIYCLIQFFRVEETKELMIWGGGFFLGMFMVTALKIWAWMQMDKNSLMREMKRLEFQVSVLVKELNNRQKTSI
jgi:hypothetical protein